MHHGAARMHLGVALDCAMSAINARLCIAHEFLIIAKFTVDAIEHGTYIADTRFTTAKEIDMRLCNEGHGG